MKFEGSLYGLSDAARIWNQSVLEISNQVGYIEIETEPYLFVRDVIIFICYVHDPFMFRKKEEAIEKVQRELSTRYFLKDLGRPKQILAMDLSWKPDGSMLISQALLITKIFNDTGV